MKIIIVGAGLAGLTCTKVLRERGAEVAVFEASDGVGGRVRTDEQDGFLLDRGFQVYFTSYPVGGRHLDYERSEEHTSELQSRQYLVCPLLLEKKYAEHHTSESLSKVYIVCG